MLSPSLPLPRLKRCEVGARSDAPIVVHVDKGLLGDAGTCIGFTERTGGVSEGPFSSLNLSPSVDSSLEAAHANISALCAALGIDERSLVRPKQVHGTAIVELSERGEDAVASVREQAEAGADGVLVTAPEGAALLCFADCAPLIVVAPSGAFAVVHAGWRGAVAGIAGDAVRALAEREAASGLFADAADAARACNAYIGPCIHVECFETGPDVTARFVERFGSACAPDERHVDLVAALRTDLERAGVVPERIADVGLCTACNEDRLFSYRASKGMCGRHGAFAARGQEGGASWA